MKVVKPLSKYQKKYDEELLTRVHGKNLWKRKKSKVSLAE